MSVSQQRDEILFYCPLICLPDSEADKIITFCERCKPKITRLYAVPQFLRAWRDNPKRPEIELNNYAREKERRLNIEKMRNQVTCHALIEMYEIKFGKLDIDLKLVEMPKRTQYRILPLPEYKPQTCKEIEAGI